MHHAGTSLSTNTACIQSASKALTYSVPLLLCGPAGSAPPARQVLLAALPTGGAMRSGRQRAREAHSADPDVTSGINAEGPGYGDPELKGKHPSYSSTNAFAFRCSESNKCKEQNSNPKIPPTARFFKWLLILQNHVEMQFTLLILSFQSQTLL